MITVTFCLFGADRSCELLISDGGDPKRLTLRTDNGDYAERAVEIENSADVSITVIPSAPAESASLGDARQTGFNSIVRDVLHHAALVVKSRLLLRVGREYTLTGLQNGDRLTLSPHTYVSEPIRLFRLMDAAPVVYSFFELNGNAGAKTVRAFPTNREDLFVVERGAMIKNFGLKMILAYPFRMGRIKRLTRERRLLRALKKYGRMSEEEREKHLRSSLRLL